MSISGLSSASLNLVGNLYAEASNSSNTWNSLGKSLSSVDLKTAQSLFKSYEQVVSGSSSLKSGSQFANDFAALSKALQRGDLSAAQSAYETANADLSNNPALTVANTQAATDKAVKWVEDLLSLSDTATSALNSTTQILTMAYGSTSSSAYGVTAYDSMLTMLNSAYGESSGSSATPATSPSTGGSSSKS